MDYKICKVYNILDNLLLECRKNKDFSNDLNKSFDVNLWIKQFNNNQ